MKKIFYSLLTTSLLFVTSACSNDDDEKSYDGETYYEGSDLRKVAGIRTTTVADGETYSWYYAFTYDTNSRISNIKGTITYHEKNKGKCIISSEADYNYTSKTGIKIAYTINYDYPESSSDNYTINGNRSGSFDENGYLLKFNVIDCEYDFARLKEVCFDYEENYQMVWNNDDLTGYYYQNNTETKDGKDKYQYSTYTNNTNIDLASFVFGFPFEVATLPAGGNILYSPFYLGAFNMIGARSLHLPEAEYTFNADGLPETMKTTTDSGLTFMREIFYQMPTKL